MTLLASQEPRILQQKRPASVHLRPGEDTRTYWKKAARKNGRTLSNFITWAVNEASRDILKKEPPATEDEVKP